MFLLISMLLFSVSSDNSGFQRWTDNDTLINDDLGPYVDYAVDYNYTNGNIFVACAVDSGYTLSFREGWTSYYSTDHGHSWNQLVAPISSTNRDYIDVDITATRADTVYLLTHYDYPATGTDFLRLYKIYDTGTGWTRDEIWMTYSVNEIRSPQLIRDDFAPFYMYLTYIIHNPSSKDTLRMIRSIDGGYSWPDTIHNSTDNTYFDFDMCVSDSTIHLIGHYYLTTGEGMTLLDYASRGMVYEGGIIITLNSDTLNKKIRYPRVGATTTTPDSNQLVYALFTQKDSVSGNWDLLYRYRSNGTWSSYTPDTLHKGSLSPVYSDIRGRQSDESEYIDIVYSDISMATFTYYTNYWRYTDESNPVNWSDSVTASSALFWSYPELTYSPGSGVESGAVIYNNNVGELWFDASWFSGIEDFEYEKNGTGNSILLFSNQILQLNTSGVDIYDLTGRIVRKLNEDFWDLTDSKGKKIEPGIYFIVNKKTGTQQKVVILK